jgi:hypothetical protein
MGEGYVIIPRQNPMEIPESRTHPLSIAERPDGAPREGLHISAAGFR